MMGRTQHQHGLIAVTLTLVTLLFLQLSLFGDDKIPPKTKETPEEHREGIVFQAIADMIANRDQLLKRYAVVLEGEFTDLEANEPRVFPMLVIRCVSKEHQYDYAAQVDFKPQLQFDDKEAIAGIRNVENWQECVQCRGDYKAFNGPKQLGEDYRQVGKGEDAMKAMREMGLVVPRFDPFDDFVAYASMVLDKASYPGFIESQLLEDSKLTSTEDLVGGQIKCTWEFKVNNGAEIRHIIMKQAQAHEYMPIEVAYKYQDTRNFRGVVSPGRKIPRDG